MAARTTITQVRELLDIDAEDSAILHNYIRSATIMVDANLLNVGHSTDVLAEIEKYLAAHFAAMYAERGGLIRDTVSAATSEYSDVFTGGLGSTRFGQHAIVMDTSGTLARIGAPKIKAEFRVV